ncbi:hypothetical protein CRE_27925 [Caenorhabditis remanei]|uniref:Uncharacterized protein n=1 Tax=Caenorhabditis remanei TaxID=31234 RepID=E3NM20_CAERE|nr:hypothetical protein CRE_27925 [Caenorhabditis remanei]
MASHQLVKLFVCFALSIPSWTLTCHFSTMCVNDYDVIDNQNVCMAYIHVPSGGFYFGGLIHDVKKISPPYNLTSGQDCQIKIVDNDQFYECFCFTPLCNHPYSVNECVSRGYTLRPIVSM